MMAARLGNVLYWAGCIVAVPFAFWAVVNSSMLLMGFLGGTTLPGENMRHILISGTAALGAWLVGRACRYVLAGK
jgi:hypothetical protein